MDVDIESLVHLEQSFYDEGFQDGYAHGRIHGSIEGRALGQEKGYEMFEELGFYEGFALTWKNICENSGRSEDRPMHHIKHLLDLIAQFPRVNPSSAAESGDSPDDLDIPKLFRQIRSRYKALCATLGIRPSLRAADGQSEDEAATEQDGSTPGDKMPKTVWSVSNIGKRSPAEQLSF